MSNFPTGITSGLRLETTIGVNPGRAMVVTPLGKLEIADHTTPLHATRPIGITTTYGEAKRHVNICFIGRVDNKDWDWDITLPVFLGTNGDLTQTVSTSGFIKILGLPCLSSTIWINPETSIILV